MQTRCQPLLGTFVEITAPRSAASALDAAFAAVRHVQQCMSFHDEGSDLARLRRAAAGTAVQVAPETVEVLQVALDLYRQSAGLFDVSIGRELVRSGFLPRPQMPFRTRYPGTSADIEIIDDRHLRCHRPMLIDLGGIAKGYAVDRAVMALQSAGAAFGLVNAGGDLRMFGNRAWEIALRDADGIPRSSVQLANCAVASSANLTNRKRRLWRTHTPHIGRGRTPLATRERITVVAQRCVIADALTKIAMADGELAREMLLPHGGYVLTETPEGMAE